MEKDVGWIVLQKTPYAISPEKNSPPTSRRLLAVPHFRPRVGSPASSVARAACSFHGVY
jgi:hypothetical protein